MQTLFDPEPCLPEGFVYLSDFISAQEEVELLTIIQDYTFHPVIFQGYEARRKVASFGWDWSFEKRQLTRGKPIPKVFNPLIEKVALYTKLPFDAFQELLLTEYTTGSVINWHRDAPPFDMIAGISLAQDCVLKLRPYRQEKKKKGSVLSQLIRRRSLYIMKDTSRREWEHSTAPVNGRRYSITLRTLNSGNRLK